MVEIGVALAVVGVGLLVAEAHVPGGVLGVTGGVTLATGLALALAGTGGGAAVIVGVVLGVVVASGLWLALVTRKALATRRLRSASGRDALHGALRSGAALGERRRAGVRGRRAMAGPAELAGLRR